MGYIEFQDEHGTYRIAPSNQPVVLDEVIEQMVVPVLLAAGYSRENIYNYYMEDPGEK